VEKALPESVEVALAYFLCVEHVVYRLGSDEQSRALAGATSTVCHVLAAMRAWPGVADLQETGARTLGGLCWQNAPNIASVVLHGGIETLRAAADAHVAAEGVQISVCQALCYVGVYSRDGLLALHLGRAAELAARVKAVHFEQRFVTDWADAALKILC